MRLSFPAAGTKSAQLPFSERLKRAFRDGSPDARQLYVAARKAGAFLRDRPRRALVTRLPATAHTMPRDGGLLVLAPGALDGVGEVVAAARAALATFDAGRPAAGKGRKRFLVNVLAADAVRLDSPILRFALRPDVLAIVSRYLGLVPLLTAVKVFHSDAVEAVPTSSQLYHCDGDDLWQVKIFIYATDVDARSGPLTVVDAAATAAVQKETGYTYNRHLSDDEVRVATPAAEHAIVGAAGTTVFVDTSRCLHYGSRVAADAPARLAVMLQYSTPYSFMLPVRYREAAPYRGLLDPSLDRIARLVLGQ